MFDNLIDKIVIGALTGLVAVLTLNHNDKKMTKAIETTIEKTAPEEDTETEEE